MFFHLRKNWYVQSELRTMLIRFEEKQALRL